jgi:hypothetical protein
MKHLKRTVFNILAALFLALFFVGAVMAQDVTPEPTPEVVENDVPDVVVVEQPSSENVILPAWQLFAYIFAAFLGGTTIGVAGAGAVARSIMNNPTALKNAESVGNSVPEGTANRLIGLADSAMSIAALLKEVLDRVPADTKAQSTETPPAAG